jgi:hypothetical protein
VEVVEALVQRKYELMVEPVKVEEMGDSQILDFSVQV